MEGRTAQVDPLEATRAVGVEAERRAATSLTNEPTLAGDMSVRPAQAVAPAELSVGAAVGRYRITGRIGAGGMGVVYRAHDPQLDREVALKLLLAQGEGGTEGRSRMLREAQAAAKIRHPNVVTVYDAGEVDGRVFIAMELIDGVTLKAWLRTKGRGWQDVLGVMLMAGEGLAAAHAVGLVHRDFKPDNVLVGTDGRAHVLDFGLARPAVDAAQMPTPGTSGLAQGTGREALLQTLTQTGMAVGTPAYMAPEQHLARPSSARSDQFAFCVATYEALYGQRPFRGDSYAELSLAVIQGQMTPPPRRTQVPAAAWQALRRGLQPEPEARYPTLADLLADLRDMLRPGLGRARLGVVAAMLALPAVAVAGAMSLQADEPPPPDLAAAVERAVELAKAIERLDATDPGGPEVREPAGPGERGEAGGADDAPSLALGKTRSVDAAALFALLEHVVPGKAGRLELVDGALELVGDGVKPWQEPLEVIVKTIDQPRRAPGPQIRVEAPDGFWGVYELGTEGFDKRMAALGGLAGVTALMGSTKLGVVLVRGDGPALDGVDRWIRSRPREPQRWCFINTSLKNQESCQPSLRQCEEDRKSWLGEAADGKSRCYGKP